MDFTISARIWASDLAQSEKLVLLALDHNGDQDGFSWHGYKSLAEMTGISAESKYLTRILNKLEKDGYILIWRQHGHKGGRGYTHIYWPIIGRTNEEILEIVMRRFIATEDEARAIISQSGLIYDDLIKRNRVSGKILEESRAIKKGVPQNTYNNEKGVQGDTLPDEKVLPETPNDEDDGKKGVLETPRSKDSLNPIESIKDNPITSPIGEGGKPPAEPKKSKPIKEPKEQPPIPAAIKVYQSIARRLPDKAIWPEIELKVGTTPECLERWGKVITAYIGCGWNKLNLVGMLRFYEENRIPSTEPIGKNGAYTNGQHSKPNQKPTGLTGAALDGEPTYDPSTQELIHPDGRREPYRLP